MENYNKISIAKSDYILIGFLLLSVLPFIILNYFNHPPHEDFFYADETNRLGFSKAFRMLYKFYGGRYLTYALISLNPLVFNSITGYRVVILFLMIAFFYVLFLFVSEATGDGLKFTEKLLFSLSIIFLYLYKMSSVEEGFYWLLSVICYHLGLILIMLFFIFYIKVKSEINNRKKIFYIFISCITVSLIPGTNELAASLIMFLLSFLIIKNFIVEKKFNLFILLFTIFGGTGFYFFITAPGITASFNQREVQHELINTIYGSFTFLTEKLLNWSFRSPLLVITALFIPVFFKIIKNKRTNAEMFSIKPFYTCAFWVIILFVNIFTVIWSTGSIPYERSLNFIYFVFLSGWFYNVIAFISYINKKTNIQVEKLPGYVYAIGILLVLLFLFRENNIKTAYTDLLGGDVGRYNDELNQRYKFISQCKSDTVVVDSIKNVPMSFYSRDLIDDNSFRSDQSFARYFNKKSFLKIKSDNEK